MNIWKVESGMQSWFVHACKVGTAINRTPLGNAQRTIGIRAEIIKKNATKTDWENFKSSLGGKTK